MEDLGYENILGEEEIETLFSDPEEVEEDVDDNPSGGETPEGGKEEKEDTAEAPTPDNLFDEEPESVGSGKDKEVGEKEDAVPGKDSGASPDNFYSSIASALAVDGIFPNLDEETISKADSAEAFSDLIEAEINARLDDRQKRVAAALEYGVEPDIIRKHENTLNYLSGVTDSVLAAENDEGERTRRNLIYQDFLNKGYTPEKAKKFTERTIDAGTDVEDAREALQSLKEYFQGQYSQLLKAAEEEAMEEKKQARARQEKITDSLMKDKTLFGGMDISTSIRKKACESISKPVYRDPDTGRYMTAIQKYEMDNPGDFMKYAGLFFALTNGFKDFDSFTKGKVKAEVRKGLRDLEQKLSGTRRNSDGSLKLVSNRDEDPESWVTDGFKLAL